mgnify:FL=1
MAITSAIPINKPIHSAIKHAFEQKFDFLLKQEKNVFFKYANGYGSVADR